jgi:hypothetical protein
MILLASKDTFIFRSNGALSNMVQGNRYVPDRHRSGIGATLLILLTSILSKADKFSRFFGVFVREVILRKQVE